MQFSMRHLFVLSLNVKVHTLNIKQFHLTHRSGATTPGQSGPGSDGNEGVFHIP